MGPILGEDFRIFRGVGFPQNWEAKNRSKNPKKIAFRSRVRGIPAFRPRKIRNGFGAKTVPKH